MHTINNSVLQTNSYFPSLAELVPLVAVLAEEVPGLPIVAGEGGVLVLHVDHLLDLVQVKPLKDKW